MPPDSQAKGVGFGNLVVWPCSPTRPLSEVPQQGLLLRYLNTRRAFSDCSGERRARAAGRGGDGALATMRWRENLSFRDNQARAVKMCFRVLLCGNHWEKRSYQQKEQDADTSRKGLEFRFQSPSLTQLFFTSSLGACGLAGSLGNGYVSHDRPIWYRQTAPALSGEHFCFVFFDKAYICDLKILATGTLETAAGTLRAEGSPCGHTRCVMAELRPKQSWTLNWFFP